MPYRSQHPGQMHACGHDGSLDEGRAGSSLELTYPQWIILPFVKGASI